MIQTRLSNNNNPEISLFSVIQFFQQLLHWRRKSNVVVDEAALAEHDTSSSDPSLVSTLNNLVNVFDRLYACWLWQGSSDSCTRIYHRKNWHGYTFTWASGVLFLQTCVIQEMDCAEQVFFLEAWRSTDIWEADWILTLQDHYILIVWSSSAKHIHCKIVSNANW